MIYQLTSILEAGLITLESIEKILKNPIKRYINIKWFKCYDNQYIIKKNKKINETI